MIPAELQISDSAHEAPAATAEGVSVSSATASSAKWRVQCITSHPSQAASPEEWNRLAGATPFRRYEWADAWWRHCPTSSSQPLVLTVRDEAGDLVGLAPWTLRYCPLRGRVISFLGSGRICSDYLGLLAAEEHQPEVARLVGNWLASEARSRWDLLHLDGVSIGDRGIQTLIDRLTAAGHELDLRRPCSTWRLPLPATWAELEKQLSRTRRERTRQSARGYFDSGRAVPRLVETPADLAHYWPIFVDLHQRRRQSLGEAGCFASASFAAFHADISQQLAARGQLRLHFVELDGRPVAADYSFTAGDTIYMYQTGFDPDYAADQPGTLNLISTLKLAIAQGYRAYDFLRGDEAYKASWRAQPTEQWDVRVVGRRTGANLRYGLLQRAARTRREVEARWQAHLDSRKAAKKNASQPVAATKREQE